MAKTTAQLHWDYFLLLEKDLVSIAETVELSQRNYSTFGPRILQLILNAGSELDVALKSLAGVISPDCSAASNKQPTMRDYKSFIANSMLDRFSTARVRYLHSEIVMTPWADLAKDPDAALEWWTAYNNVKHQRAKCYECATLEVALEVTAALFVADLYIAEASSQFVFGSTQIVDWEFHIRYVDASV